MSFTITDEPVYIDLALSENKEEGIANVSWMASVGTGWFKGIGNKRWYSDFAIISWLEQHINKPSF